MIARNALVAGLFGLVLAALPAAGSGGDAAAQALSVEDARTRAMVPGAARGVGYAAIRNEGDTADTLVAASSERAGRVEIHETTVQDDVMRMRPLDHGLEIAAGDTVALEPGGLHLMFLEVDEPFAPGEEIEVALEFARAGRVDAAFTVETGAGHGDDGESGHDRHDGEH